MDKEMQFLLYSTPNENIKVDAIIRDKTIWFTQKGMADLFEIDKSGINRQQKKVFESGELKEEVVVAEIAIPTHVKWYL